MNIIFYVIVFIVGALLGSFLATITKRITKNKKVFCMHSYCANCGKKLTFFEKIPILSYILLRGKCKNCKNKIDSNYIILEVLTGFLILSIVYTLNLTIYNFNITNLISCIFIVLYFSYIIITVGVDKQSKNMSPSVLAYGIIISLIYIIYACITEKASLYKNVIYLIVMTILLLLNIINTKKRAQGSYVIDLLTMLLIMLVFTGEIICILTISATLFSIALYILINKIRKSKNKSKKNKNIFSSNVKISFMMGILNLLIFLTLVNISK